MTIKEYIEKKNRVAKMIEGKSKIETSDVLDKEITLNGYGFMTDNNKEYAIVTLKENPDNFLFCGSVLTDEIRNLEETFGAELDNIMKNEGIKIKLFTQKSKNGRNYTSVKFIED